MTNNHGTAYLVIRFLVRSLFVLLVMTAIVIGIPLAVELVWPGLLLAGGLMAVLILLHLRDRHVLGTTDAG